MGTAFAVLAQLPRPLDKSQLFPSGINLIQPVLVKIPQPVFIQHIKITGIDASVRLHHILDSADSALVAGFRHIACRKPDIIFKLPDVRLTACLQIPGPDILAGIAYIVVFSFITASPSGALNGVGPVAMDFFNGLGLSAGTSAKLLGLSTFTGVPPHSSGIATGVMVCKFEYKKIIGVYVKVPLVAGIAAIAACLLMIQFGI